MFEDQDAKNIWKKNIFKSTPFRKINTKRGVILKMMMTINQIGSPCGVGSHHEHLNYVLVFMHFYLNDYEKRDIPEYL